MTANFGKYLRFITRRERVVGLIWILALVGSAALFASIYPRIFPSSDALAAMVGSMNTPAMVAMMGPVYGLESLTVAMAMAQQCLLWLALTAIIMNIFFVNRHTRTDEELGRHEMLASLPVGRLTGSLSTITGAFALNVIISLLTAVFLCALNIDGTTAAGAFAYGFSIGAQGFAFAAITLLTAQLFSTARGSMGVSFAILGAAYILRASGDMNGSALSVISPLGLGLKVEAFYANNFTPIFILLVEAFALIAIALVINAKRDIGAGVFAARKGREHASRFLQNPLGLAWRLSKTSFLAWSLAFLILGASYGAVVGELDNFVAGNDTIRQMIEASGGANSLATAFLAMLSSIMAVLISVPVVGAINRLYSEEKRGRLEQIFSKSVSRAKLYGGFITVAVIESVVLEFLLAAGLCVASSGELSFGLLLKTGFTYLPAIWVMSGLVVLLVGFIPKLTAVIWAVFGYTFLVMYFGRIMDVPEWAQKITPFGNIPQLPVQEFTIAPLLILTFIAAALTALGVWRFKERDIA